MEMTNEWLEFQAYTKKPTYSAEALKVGDGLESEPAEIGKVVLTCGGIGWLLDICLKF